MEKNSALTQRVSYSPSAFTEFLWWLSTAEKELLVDAVIIETVIELLG